MDIEAVPNDLTNPPVSDGIPSPGRRVRRVLPAYAGTDIYHALYLPEDWEESVRFPVVVEYPGNRYQGRAGSVDECCLGYGITGGTGAIWLCLPFVDTEAGRNAPSWWGDVDATMAYCKNAVEEACNGFGGDPARIFIAGFSRGAIACNYIGLRDDEIAGLWRGFICHSHYDGVVSWGYEGDDRAAAGRRLERLGRRPVFVSHEQGGNAGTSIDDTVAYLRAACPDGDFTFLELPFGKHTDTWVLRDIRERTVLREWYRSVTAVSGNDPES